MRVFVAGASGAIGQQLLPMLLAAGHTVHGMTRSASKAETIRSVGADPIVADAFDAEAVATAIARAAPDVIVYEMTAISPSAGVRNLDRELAVTNRLRTEGTRNLLRAAIAAKTRRFIVQSFAGWPFARVCGPVKTEVDPFDPTPPQESPADARRDPPTRSDGHDHRRIGMGCLALRGSLRPWYCDQSEWDGN